MLWFDVESINFTTCINPCVLRRVLWFDVESINFTTCVVRSRHRSRCGLMWNLLTLQRTGRHGLPYSSCGLM